MHRGPLKFVARAAIIAFDFRFHCDLSPPKPPGPLSKIFDAETIQSFGKTALRGGLIEPIMVASDVQTVSPSELLPVLTSLLSNPANLREREKTFQHMLRNTGALASLYEIACEKSLSLAVRTLAIIQFKNAIENWRFKRSEYLFLNHCSISS